MAQAHLLIVEGKSVAAKNFQQSLQNLGYTVAVVASSGAQVMGSVKTAAPHLVLMDVRLEGETDSFELAQQIREQLDIPVIYLTTQVDEPAWLQAQIVEPFGYIHQPFTEKELWMAVEMALRNHTLEKKLKEQERLLVANHEQQPLAEILAEVTLVLASQTSQAAILDEILRQTQRVVPYSAAHLMLLEDDILRIVRWQGYEIFGGQELLSRLTQPVGNFPLDAVAIHSQQPLVIPDTRQDPHWVAFEETNWVRSHIVAPICLHGRVLGLLRLDGNTPNQFSAESVKRLQPLINAVAIGLEHVRLLEAEREQRLLAEALGRVGLAFNAVLDLPHLLDLICQESMTLFEVGAAYIWLVQGGDLVGFAGQGPGREQFIGLHLRLTDTQTLGSRVIREKRPIFVNDAHHSDGINQHLVKLLHVKALLGIPLLIEDKAVGALIIIDTEQTHRFGPDDVEIAAVFGNYATIAIHNASLYEQVQHYATELEARVAERTFELQVLYELAQALGQATQLGDVVRLILLYLYQTIPHDVAANLLVTGATGTLVIQSQHPLSSEVETQLWEVLTSAFSYLRGQTLDPAKLEIRRIQSKAGASIRPPLESLASLMQVPILVGQVPVGLLLVAAEQQNKFTKEQAFLLRTMADQAAESIQRLQSLLAAEHQRLESLVAHLPNGVILLDAEQRIVLVNQAVQKSLALLTKAKIGDKLTELDGQPLAPLLLADAAGSSYELEIKDQFRQVFDVTAKPMAVGPEAGGWMLIIRDISEERAAQQRIQQQERLAAVGQLAAGIAHDFNNILTSVIGFAELARIHPDIPDSAGEDLDRIIRQGQRATRLIRQILDFSRQSIAEKRQVDPVPFLKETIKLLERTIPEDIRIILEIEPGEYTLNADPTQLQQALTNLAVNARDAMPTGGILRFHLSKLILSQDECPPCPQMLPGHWIALSVSDTGTGISPEVLPRIFEPFFTTKEVGKGTGLGLAQVYGIITQHEGCIDVETKVGVGTTLTLYLPALPGRQKIVAQVTEVKVVPGDGEVILLVEDDAGVLEVTQAMLKHLGYQVVTATNGQHALEVYEQHQQEIALVLTDATMPEMGGVALSQALQAKNPAIKVVALTGYPLETEAKALLARGIVDWLQKPLNIEQLAQTISRSLKLKGEQDRLPIDF